ncbi:hypothetical protein EXIGLDRAFT_766658 [Exidia glandulosa HHB12029]|uniref:Uncharacterized protein n=1 Tax=Exidia glandulosa HHB12029 TaxID=1314781 RepID=A0A165JJ57_EXIGL|nr:hypothetical protein EXIGLDRAFT_766658 [Exidia glandulosa HHB12029]
MLVIDDPTWLDRPFEGSTFVVMAIDPVASVEDLDDQARDEAAQIHPRKYLALLDDDVGIDMLRDARMPKLRLDFYLAHTGLPDSPEEWAATPIAPAPAHPTTGRLPILPSYALPWPNCHIHTLNAVIAAVSRIYQYPAPGPSLNAEARTALGHHRLDDTRAYQPPEDDDSVGDDEDYEDALAELREEMLELEVYPQPADDDATGMFDIIPQDTTPQMMLHVEVWVDVNSIEWPSNPADLGSEIKRLRKIEWNWAQRVVAEALANRSETSAWLEGISGADTPSVEVVGEAVEDQEGDMSIVPEDAIEHRAERQAEVDETPEAAVTLSSTRAPSDLVPSPVMSTVTSSMRRTSSSLSVQSDNSPGTSFPRSIAGFLQGFLAMFSRITPYASRFQSLFLAWLWRPFAR